MASRDLGPDERALSDPFLPHHHHHPLMKLIALNSGNGNLFPSVQHLPLLRILTYSLSLTRASCTIQDGWDMDWVLLRIVPTRPGMLFHGAALQYKLAWKLL